MIQRTFCKGTNTCSIVCSPPSLPAERVTCLIDNGDGPVFSRKIYSLHSNKVIHVHEMYKATYDIILLHIWLFFGCQYF